MKKAPRASTSSTAWRARPARRSADRPCRRRSRRSFGRRHGPAASEGRPFHRKAPSSQHSRMASAGLIARTMLLTRHRKTASAFRSRDSATALPPFRPKLRARRGRPSKFSGRRLSARHQRRRAGPAVIRRSSGATGVTLSACPTNSVFTACLIFVLDKIQSLDHASESSLELDNYSRTTIRYSNKPRPWCMRTRERYRRNRHNRSCSCPFLYRWPAESGRASRYDP
jgi:hypothetical protein